MSDSLFDLSGRTAFVTGGTTGIGAAIAAALSSAGARVWVHALDAEQGRAHAEQRGFGFLAADFSDPAQVDGLATALASATSTLDILVNNAGLEIGAIVDHLEPAVVDRTLAVNLTAPMRLTQLLLPLLRRSSAASVINVTSIHDDVPSYGNAAYCASKAALEMFTRTAAVELGPEGIRVNALAPGAIETDLNRTILDEIGRDRFARWIPAGRVGRADEMAGPAVFLASAASTYVSGATLVVDGAYSRHLVRYRSSSHT